MCHTETPGKPCLLEHRYQYGLMFMQLSSTLHSSAHMDLLSDASLHTLILTFLLVILTSFPSHPNINQCALP